MNEEKEVKIDHKGIIQQITDKVILDLMTAIMPDDQTRKLVSAMVLVHRKYGIDAATSMKIMAEIATIFTEGEKEN